MELKELITKAQSGDERARTELIQKLKQNGAMRQLSRYLYRNRLLEADEVKGEFWLGIAHGLLQVRDDIGNPLQYLIQRGLWQVQSALRAMIGKGVFYTCLNCGHQGRIRGHGKVATAVHPDKTEEGKLKIFPHWHCDRCGSNVDTFQREIPYGRVPEISVEKKVTSIRIDIEEFKIKLSPKENEVMNMMLSGYHKGEERGYMRKIAERMGTSPQCVNIRLKSIKKKLTEHLKD